MRITIIKNRLRMARRSWAGGELSPDVTAQGNYVTGVLRGFREALQIVEQTQCEDIEKSKAERRPLSRWTGLRLYKACQHACGRLKEGDRSSAMRILRRALDSVSF